MTHDTPVMSTTERLVYMAHQIARNVACMSEESAATAVAEHLTKFWDPRMKEQIIVIARDEPHRLSPLVAAAVAYMIQVGPTAHPASEQFNSVNEVGHCDAG